MKSSNAEAFRLPGMTSRFVYGRSGDALPISRQISTQAMAAFMSSGCDSVLASIWIGSSGPLPVKTMRPWLFGRTTHPNRVQEAAGGLNLAAVSALQIGISPWHVCKSGVSRVRAAAGPVVEREHHYKHHSGRGRGDAGPFVHEANADPM